MTKKHRTRLQAQVAQLEKQLVELRAAKQPDERAIQNAERVLHRWKAELDPDHRAPQPDKPAGETVSQPAPEAVPAA